MMPVDDTKNELKKSHKSLKLDAPKQSPSLSPDKTQSASSTEISSEHSEDSRESYRKNSLLNIFNNRNTKELNNLKAEAKIMNFDSVNLSNEELVSKYNVFCHPEKASNEAQTKETTIDVTNLSLNEVIEKKVKIIKLIDQVYKDIRTVRKISKRCEEGFKQLQDILHDFFS